MLAKGSSFFSVALIKYLDQKQWGGGRVYFSSHSRLWPLSRGGGVAGLSSESRGGIV